MEAWAESLAAALHEVGVDVTLFRGAGPAKNGYDVVLPCVKRTQPIAKVGDILNRVGAWRFGLGSAASVESFSFGIGLLRRLREGFDLVHVQQGSLALFLDRASKLGFLKCPIVFGNGQKAPLDFLRRFEYAHFLSPFGMQEVLGDGEKPRYWRIIPNFVNPDVFCPGGQGAARAKFGFPEESLIVLSVGIVDNQVKRMGYFVKEIAAMREATESSVHCVIAGSATSDSAEIERLGKELLGRDLTILYDLKGEVMPSLYQAADIFALCSPREAFGMACLEAMSCGLPVVCHKFPTIQWLIGEGGLAVDMMKEGSLCQALAHLQKNSLMREALGCSARQRAIEQFSVEAVIASILEMYQEVVASRRTCAPSFSQAHPPNS
jgi:glycosyltransferase involved in cell wall biosynthesis